MDPPRTIEDRLKLPHTLPSAIDIPLNRQPFVLALINAQFASYKEKSATPLLSAIGSTPLNENLMQIALKLLNTLKLQYQVDDSISTQSKLDLYRKIDLASQQLQDRHTKFQTELLKRQTVLVTSALSDYEGHNRLKASEWSTLQSIGTKYFQTLTSPTKNLDSLISSLGQSLSIQELMALRHLNSKMKRQYLSKSEYSRNSTQVVSQFEFVDSFLDKRIRLLDAGIKLRKIELAMVPSIQPQYLPRTAHSQNDASYSIPKTNSPLGLLNHYSAKLRRAAAIGAGVIGISFLSSLSDPSSSIYSQGKLREYAQRNPPSDSPLKLSRSMENPTSHLQLQLSNQVSALDQLELKISGELRNHRNVPTSWVDVGNPLQGVVRQNLNSTYSDPSSMSRLAHKY